MGPYNQWEKRRASNSNTSWIRRYYRQGAMWRLVDEALEERLGIKGYSLKTILTWLWRQTSVIRHQQDDWNYEALWNTKSDLISRM